MKSIDEVGGELCEYCTNNNRIYAYTHCDVNGILVNGKCIKDENFGRRLEGEIITTENYNIKYSCKKNRNKVCYKCLDQ